MVGAAGLEPRHLDVNGVAQLGAGDHRPFPRDRAEARVLGDLPQHLHGLGGHAVADLQRLGREPGPDHEAVRRRLAGRHTELERVGGEDRIGHRPPRQRQREGGNRPRTETSQHVLPREVDTRCAQPVGHLQILENEQLTPNWTRQSEADVETLFTSDGLKLE